MGERIGALDDGAGYGRKLRFRLRHRRNQSSDRSLRRRLSARNVRGCSAWKRKSAGPTESCATAPRRHRSSRTGCASLTLFDAFVWRGIHMSWSLPGTACGRKLLNVASRFVQMSGHNSIHRFRVRITLASREKRLPNALCGSIIQEVAPSSCSDGGSYVINPGAAGQCDVGRVLPCGFFSVRTPDFRRKYVVARLHRSPLRRVAVAVVLPLHRSRMP
jgi:hypothetical protein